MAPVTSAVTLRGAAEGSKRVVEKKCMKIAEINESLSGAKERTQRYQLTAKGCSSHSNTIPTVLYLKVVYR